MRINSLQAQLVVVACLAIAFAGCSKAIDLREHLKVVDVSTGWFDAGIVREGNKLVPSITFRLHNVSRQKISGVQIHAVFRRVNETEEWDSAYARPIGRNGLAPGEKSQPITLRSRLGYTGSEPRAQMLQNRHFRDARAEVFGKHGSQEWMLLAAYPIARQLLTK